MSITAPFPYTINESFARSDLRYNICSGCGEPEPQGLFANIMHQCPRNTVTHRRGGFKIQDLIDVFSKTNRWQPFEELLNSEYFNAMPDYDSATDLERKIYGLCRDSAVRTMKRLRNYIELEKDFDAKY